MKRGEMSLDPQITEAEENFLIDCQFLVQDLINAKGISRSELARRAGISKARLSQIMAAEANPTVKTFARLFHALGAKVALEAVDDRRKAVKSPQDEVKHEWKIEEIKDSSQPARVQSRRSKNVSSDWMGASNDNYMSVSSDARSFQLKAA